MAKKQRKRQRQAVFRFGKSLVLFQYILNLFEAGALGDLCEGMKASQLEGFDEDNVSRFHNHLVNKLFERQALPNDMLLQYDQNIVSHTLRISRKREGFRWKYFQYMALLFTEIYLDKYFQSSENFMKNLNDFVTQFNINKEPEEHVTLYTPEDLNKIAFWQATGSGKTLIMHVNILQYQHYLKKYGRQDEVNRTILLTPNEGLSEQHRREFLLSGLDAELFNKDAMGLFRSNAIEIIDVHKLKEESGEKTVGVDCFEGNNLVLVDEGHRGAGGEEWMDKRNRLCEDGFSFEYSATFGQAMKASGKKDMLQQYAKCIVFDYSYKYFYRDGYGKEYSILNLAEDRYEEQRNLYLTACLLSFYQQLLIYDDHEREFSPFLLEEPLWVFVGSKVNAVRTEGKKKVSDVVDILLFLNSFLKHAGQSIEYIDRLLTGTSQLNDTKGRDLFAGRFTYLIEKGMDIQDVYADVRRLVFNCASPEAQMHLDNLKGVQGEIGVRLGDNEYFGVINVGDDRDLIKLCEQNGLLASDKDFSDSLFQQLSERHSPVKILIGSKKFTEGWNSWRVSTMGLMNMGKSEGAEIIQLFGRGVRLKGYDMSLKRSSYIKTMKVPNHIGTVETLNVFGVKADYMRQFREYLEEEGVKGKDDYEEIVIPAISNLGTRKLKYLQLKEGVDFKKHGSRPTLGEPDEYLLERPITVDWYPKIEAIQSRLARSTATATLHEGKLRDEQLAFIDYEKVYFELQKYKNERTYYNLNIQKELLPVLLRRTDWYILYIPEEELVFHSFEQVQLWQDIVITMLKKYCDHFYHAKKLDYEKDKMEYKYLDEVEAALEAQKKKGNIIDEYTFLVEKSREDIILKLNELKQKIKRHDFSDFEFRSLRSFTFDQHLYKPLIYIKDSEIKVVPVALNEGENQFVVDLKKYYEGNTDYFQDKELYLLRNLGRGRGVGFFQAHNFYPDFIMWIVFAGKQYISFIDPHGIRHAKGLDDRKIRFHEEIKTLENQIGDRDVILNSFIISVTEFRQISWWEKRLKKEELEANHVVFQEGDDLNYINKIYNILCVK
ncbi:MAG: DEAD/DEAH box helicase family protein [Candidatus Brocadiaceae bacterium]|nr:DEAD/DEAH box helicase family protein [Candidatus Brocadiaceae bacterium]